MDKYQKLRADVERVSKEVIGKTTKEAQEICNSAGLACRWVRVDGDATMITADCRMDRIGFIINQGKVTETCNG